MRGLIASALLIGSLVPTEALAADRTRLVLWMRELRSARPDDILEPLPAPELLADRIGYFPTIDLVSREEAAELVGGRFFEALSDCRGALACRGDVLSAGGVDQVLAITVDRTSSPVLSGEVIGDRAVERGFEPISNAGLAGQIFARVDDLLLRAGHTKGGRVTLEGPLEGAQIWMDGLPAQPGRLPLAIGSHHLLVQKDGVTWVDEKLTLAPGQDIARHVEAPPEEPSHIGWYIAGGAAAVAIGVAVAIVLTLPKDLTLCHADTPEQCK